MPHAPGGCGGTASSHRLSVLGVRSGKLQPVAGDHLQMPPAALAAASSNHGPPTNMTGSVGGGVGVFASSNCPQAPLAVAVAPFCIANGSNTCSGPGCLTIQNQQCRLELSVAKGQRAGGGHVGAQSRPNRSHDWWWQQQQLSQRQWGQEHQENQVEGRTRPPGSIQTQPAPAGSPSADRGIIC